MNDDERAEGDIAAYANWRRDPSRITADSIEGAALLDEDEKADHRPGHPHRNGHVGALWCRTCRDAEPSAPQALDVPEGCTEAGLFRIPFDRDAWLLPPEADEWDEQAIGAFYAGVAEGVAVVENRYCDSAEWRRSSKKAARLSRLPSEEEERHPYNGGICCDKPLADHAYASVEWVAAQDWYGPVSRLPSDED